MREFIAALWAVWFLYQFVQLLTIPRPASIGTRLGYILSTALAGSTSYLLVNP